MINENARPFDYLDQLKTCLVEIKVRYKKEVIRAQLLCFDQSINLVIMNNGRRCFIKGDDVIFVEEYKGGKKK